MESSRSTSPAEERQILESWNPEPLIPEIDRISNRHLLTSKIVTSSAGKYITVDGVECLNLGTHNYLGLADHPRLESSSLEALRKYGVGSCGPRAFYGTMDVHLKLEEEIANFLGVQEAALYSFGFSAIASAIPAYAKPKDIVFVDECCNFAIQQGLVASKSQLIKFKHNDVKHLESLIEEVMDNQKRRYGRIDKIRTFLIVEGIYANTGKICNLVKMVELKKRYKIRLFIDESRSFGVLGSEGKGITQHHGVDIQDVDLIMASLENALCAYGGFCAGSSYIVDHQRLAGAGYCFSASLPPLQTRVALESLYIIKEDPSIVSEAQAIFARANEVLSKLTKLTDTSDVLSPIKLLVIKSPGSMSVSEQEDILSDVCSRIMSDERLAFTVARYIRGSEMTNPPAAIRLIISGSLTHPEIERVFSALERVSNALI